MNWPDPDTLRLFQGPGLCQWCGRWCPCRDAHHLRRKLMGGGQIDHFVNLLACCRECHTFIQERAHKAVLEMVAWRERTTAEKIDAFMDLVRRLPKASPLPEFER